jgi:hypothetical protein
VLPEGTRRVQAVWWFSSAFVARHNFVRSLGGLRPPQDDIAAKAVRRQLRHCTNRDTASIATS